MVSVGAQVSGQVKKMYVKLGDQVKQGQLIAQIDSVRQSNDLKTAEANIKNQQAQLTTKQATLAKAEAEYNRQKNMFAQDATSKADYDSALAAFKQHKLILLRWMHKLNNPNLHLQHHKKT